VTALFSLLTFVFLSFAMIKPAIIFVSASLEPPHLVLLSPMQNLTSPKYIKSPSFEFKKWCNWTEGKEAPDIRIRLTSLELETREKGKSESVHVPAYT